MRNNKLYCLRCPHTLEIRYIGITCKPLRYRLTQHINSSKSQNTHKANWINKLTNDNCKPIIEILVDNLTYEESLLLEVEYIKKYREIGNITNITAGGDSNPALLDSVKEKISKSRIGKCLKEETKKKLRDMFTGDKNPFYDKKHTNESKEKMSNAVKKSFSNIEIIEKLSTIKNKIKRPLYQFDMNGNFIKEWDSVSRIKRELNFDRKTIKQVCNGVYKQAYGFIWKYKN